jgi:phage host-nuclease inhibitor protein Gam
MNLRLLILAIMLLLAPVICHAQSLGDVARETRAEKQKNGAPHAKVITNEDIDSAAPPQARDTSNDSAAKETTAKAGEEVANSPASDKPAASTDANSPASADAAERTTSKSKERAKTDAAKEHEKQELETQQRTAEINKRYLDRIATLHDQINTAQLLLTKLQAQQIDNTNEFKRTVAMSPTLGEYEAQQRSFIEQIEAQRSLITSLNTQLEDAREAARHAGVPHASDY